MFQKNPFVSVFCHAEALQNVRNSTNFYLLEKQCIKYCCLQRWGLLFWLQIDIGWCCCITVFYNVVGWQEFHPRRCQIQARGNVVGVVEGRRGQEGWGNPLWKAVDANQPLAVQQPLQGLWPGRQQLPQRRMLPMGLVCPKVSYAHAEKHYIYISSSASVV